MLKEIARYGKFKVREEPEQENKGVVEVVDTVNKKVSNRKPTRKLTDVFNPWEIYDYDKEVTDNEFNLLEQDSD